MNLWGDPVSQPQISKDGKLYFSRKPVADKSDKPTEDRVSIEVFRLLEDAIPFLLTSRIEIMVSGRAREISLPSVLPEGYTPLSIRAKFPVRIDGDKLRAQVKPGIWTIELRARATSPVNQFSFFTSGDLWPSSEVWAFKDRSEFRQVELKGAQSIDPQQTRLPKGWKRLPAFLSSKGTVLTIDEKKRGNPTPPANDLRLDRQIWLNFDGNSYSIRDQIQGTMNRDWRLNVQDELKLGRVSSNDQGRFITESLEGKKGVELRDQSVSLVAESLMTGDIGKISATGWDVDFSTVSTALFLPPGWSVISVSGADKTPGTWIGKWSLLDLFFLLLVSAAVLKLWNWRWSLVAAATLVLTTHDFMAPYWIWPNLIVATALIRVVSKERIVKWINRYRLVTCISLVLISLPYLITEVRTGIYPQLEHGIQYVAASDDSGAYRAAPQAKRPMRAEFTPSTLPSAIMEEILETKDMASAPAVTSGSIRGLATKKEYDGRRAKPMPAFDPDAKIQTGPGMPEWSGNRVMINWSGPVERNQSLEIIYVSPLGKLVMALLKVFLITALALCVIDLKQTLPAALYKRVPARFMTGLPALILAGLMLAYPGSEVVASDMPSPELLEELERRLTQKPECLPDCAAIQRAYIKAVANELRVVIQVYASVNSYLTLPIHTRTWQPSHVTINGGQTPGMKVNDQGFLMVQVPEGNTEIYVDGALEGFDTLSLPMPEIVHNVTVDTGGWTVAGVDRRQNIQGQLLLTRQKTQAQSQQQVLRASSMPAFLRVTRTLNIGLDWEVQTRVQRLSGGGDPILATLPLLPGESVHSTGFEVDGEQIKIEMGSGQRELSWTSSLTKADQLKLATRTSFDWVEVWELNISPVWRIDSSGIPQINHKRRGQLGPTWHPWPGETLDLKISRPKGVDGPTLTMKRVVLEVTPGERITENSLNIQLLASQGGHHTIQLPKDAQVKSVTVDNKPQVIEEGLSHIELPIHPGNQAVLINWRERRGLSHRFVTPEVELGLPAVNTHINLKTGRDRWVLFLGGPNQGPAILFWGALIMVVFVAIGLGRIKGLPIKTAGWVLLGIGLLPVSIETSLLVIGWLLVLHYRGQKSERLHSLAPYAFNLTQVVVVLLTLIAAASLIFAIEQGLLGSPDMQIRGNGSWSSDLRWYEDRGDSTLATAWVLSVPMIYYRIAMLLWALWLAFSCLKWINWGWSNFTAGGAWKAPIPRPKKKGRRKGFGKSKPKETAADGTDDLVLTDEDIALPEDDDLKK